MDIYFATASPRRIKIIESLGLNFKIIKPMWETKVIGKIVEEVAMLTALEKARSVIGYVDEGLIVSMDTLIEIEGKIIGKPRNAKDARDILRNLSGKKHKVVTGIAVIDKQSNIEETDFEVTHVKFSNLSDEEINCYVHTGEPLDKAGAYGIQGYAAFLIEGIEGDYYNVIGFPLRKLRNVLKKFEIDIFKQSTKC